MIINGSFEISFVLMAFMALGAILIGGLLASMHFRHQYHPNLIGALIGANVGGRKRYVEALIERSRQLTIERDQQAQLATAAERTRIAREMHDIVSHSLTVIVALSEGAAATTETERARSAARTAADTARGALTEMRAMLGVLRTDDTGSAPLAPLTAPSPREVWTACCARYPRLAARQYQEYILDDVGVACGRSG